MGTTPVGTNGLTTIDGVSLVDLVDDYRASMVAADSALSAVKAQAVSGDTSTLNAAKADAADKVQVVAQTANIALATAGNAVDDADNAVDRVSALESASGFGPTSPADGTTADLIGNDTTLSAGAVDTRIDKKTNLVNVRDFGAVGDGVADDTAAIQAAHDAAGYGTVVYPTGLYKLTAPIAGFWNPARTGDGILTDGTTTFRITPRHFGDTNVLWVNGATGSDTSDGLFPGTAVSSLSGLNSIFAGFRGEAERGTWKVRISGTNLKGFTFTALPQFRNFLTFEGDPLVAGAPVTTIAYDGTSSFGMRFEPSEYLKVELRNLKATGFTVGANGYGFLFKGGGYVRAYDCIADGCDIGFGAINNVSFTFSGCVSRNNTADGFRSQYSSSGGWSNCYSHNNAGNGFFISRNSVGHLDDSRAESNTFYGLLADMNSRIATIGTSFKKNAYGVRLEGGAEWNRDDTRPNLFHIGTADANTVPFGFFGNSRMTTLHSIKGTNEFKLFGVNYNASGSTWHTGTTTETLMVNPPSDQIIPPEMFLDGGKKLRVRYWGRYQGSGGTKTVTLKIGNPDWSVSSTLHSTVFAADGFKTFYAEVEMSPRPTAFTTVDGLARVQKSGTAADLTILNVAFNPAAGIKPRIYAALAAAADQVRIDGFEFYSIG